MPVQRPLPYGRGFSTDYRAREEQLESRKLLLSGFAGVALTTADSSTFHTTADGPIQTANRLSFARLPTLAEDAYFTRVRIRVTAGAAGTARVGLYLLHRPTRTLALVPASSASWSTATAGRKTDPVDCTLLRGEQYYFGCLCTSLVPTFVVSAHTTSSPPEPILFVNAVTLPGEVSTRVLSFDDAAAITRHIFTVYLGPDFPGIDTL